MLFSEVLASVARDGDGWTATVPADWVQGRTAFGGLQVALAVRAMRALLPEALPLRTVQATFLAPVGAGTARLRARLLRSGKNALHLEARIVDGDDTLCLVVAIFGRARESAVQVQPPPPEPVTQQAPVEFPFIPGFTPSFTRYFRIRWLLGTPPFTNRPQTENVMDVSLPDAAPVDAEFVIAIADFPPPLGLAWLSKPVPGASMTWMIEFLRDDFAALAHEHWRLDVSLQGATGGYLSQSTVVRAPDGAAVALSRQSMVVFA